MLRAALACFVGFLVLAVAVAGGTLTAFDRSLEQAVQGARDCALLRPSELGSYPFALEISVLAAAALSLTPWRRGLGIWSLAPWLVFASLVSEVTFKLVVPQPGPPVAFVPASWGCATAAYRLPVSWTPPNTYPSGYAARMAFFAIYGVGLAHSLIGRRAAVATAILAMPAAGFLGATRLYLGWHWPSDVLGGGLLGAALAFVALHPLSAPLPVRRGSVRVSLRPPA